MVNWICEFGAVVYRKFLVFRIGWKLDFGFLVWRCFLIFDFYFVRVWGVRVVVFV